MRTQNASNVLLIALPVQMETLDTRVPHFMQYQLMESENVCHHLQRQMRVFHLFSDLVARIPLNITQSAKNVN